MVIYIDLNDTELLFVIGMHTMKLIIFENYLKITENRTVLQVFMNYV